MVLTQALRKPSALALAALLLLASLLPAFIQQKAGAYNLVTSRKITMSSSVNGDTGVTYDVQFTVGSSHTIGSVAVQFCSQSPIVGDTCTAPTGFDVDSATEATGANDTVGDYTKDATETVANRFVAAVDAPAANTNADIVNITLSNVTNPTTTNTSFYARLYTYTSADGTGSEVDAGGVALSTAAQITVTSKVQERLVFCVFTTGAGNDCSGKSGTAVTLGDTNGVLDPAGVYVDKNAKFAITTNATSDAVVRLKGSTLYRNADTSCASAVNCITEFSGTPNGSTPGSEEFGLCVYESAGSGLVEDAVYDGGAGAECSGTSQTAGTGSTGGDNSAEFALDTSAVTGTRSTYGDTLATKPAGSYSTGNLVFAGNISNITEAGIYATTFTFIATGTY